MTEENQEQKNQPLVLDFTTCPNCGSERRIAGEVLKKQIEKKLMPENSNAFLYTHQSIIAGRVGTWLSAPVVISFYDMCMDCGTVWCIHAEVQTVVQGAKASPTKFSTS